MSAPANPTDQFDVLAAGLYPPGRVRIRYSPLPRPTTPELDRLIAEEWARQTARAATGNVRLFNGELIRYISHQFGPDALHLTVGPTCYRDFVGTNLYNGYRLGDVDWANFANPIGTTATLVTADGFAVLGRRSERVAFHAGHLHTFGGALEQEDFGANGEIDAFGSVLRELREELALTAADLDELMCVGLIRDRQIHQPELLFEARLSLRLLDLIDRHRAAAGGDEHVGLAAVEDRPDLLAAFLSASDPVAPVAAAALGLHASRSR